MTHAITAPDLPSRTITPPGGSTIGKNGDGDGGEGSEGGSGHPTWYSSVRSSELELGASATPKGALRKTQGRGRQ